jgi:toxin-antitoxin system PIN domain toxin
VRVVDANVLLYAVNADASHHAESQRWLDRALAGADTVGFAWIVLLAFLRLATKVELFPKPLSWAEASAQVTEWLSAPGAQLVHPGNDHMSVLDRLLERTGSGGNLVNDAHLAAIALHHRAEVVSYDTDFGRFDELRWRRPTDLSG